MAIKINKLHKKNMKREKKQMKRNTKIKSTNLFVCLFLSSFVVPACKAFTINWIRTLTSWTHNK